MGTVQSMVDQTVLGNMGAEATVPSLPNQPPPSASSEASQAGEGGQHQPQLGHAQVPLQALAQPGRLPWGWDGAWVRMVPSPARPRGWWQPPRHSGPGLWFFTQVKPADVYYFIRLLKLWFCVVCDSLMTLSSPTQHSISRGGEELQSSPASSAGLVWVQPLSPPRWEWPQARFPHYQWWLTSS